MDPGEDFFWGGAPGSESLTESVGPVHFSCLMMFVYEYLPFSA